MIALNLGIGAIEAELWRLLFVMVRIGAALLAAPFFGAVAIPVQLRIILAGALAVMVCVWSPIQVPPALLSLPGVLAIAAEALVGLTLGFVLQLTFAAPLVAAEVIGGAMGLSMAATVDPQNGAHSPALGQYFSVMLIVIFLGFGAHLEWLKLVVESYRLLPPGNAWLAPDQIIRVVSLASAMFMAAVAIALPITLALLLMQVITGVISRSAPALNLFSVGLPLGVLAGMAMLVVVTPLTTEQFTQLSADGLANVAAVIAK